MAETFTEIISKKTHRRIDIADADFLLEKVKHAALMIEPDDIGYRKAFENIFPYLYTLRNKGYGYPQLQMILAEAGLKYQLSTVKAYYIEFSLTNMDKAQAVLNDWIIINGDAQSKVRAMHRDQETNSLADTIALRKEAALARLQSSKEFQSAKPLPQKIATASPSPQKSAGQSPASAEMPAASEFSSLVDTSLNTRTQKTGSAFLGESLEIPVVVIEQPPSNKITTSKESPKLNESASPIVPEKTGAALPPSPISTLHCLPLHNGIKPLQKREIMPPDFYTDIIMEHPVIPNLFLNLDERIYGELLEISDENGEIRFETLIEKSYRIRWSQPKDPVPLATSKDFVQLNPNLVKKT